MAKSKPFFPPPIEQTGSIARYMAGLRSQKSETTNDHVIELSATPVQPITQVQAEGMERVATVDSPSAIVSASTTTETSSAITEILSQICDAGDTTGSDEAPAGILSERVNKSVVLDAVSVPSSATPVDDVVKQTEILPTTSVIEAPVNKRSSSKTATPRQAKSKSEISDNSNCEIENYIFSLPQAYTTNRFVRGEMKIRITAQNAGLLRMLINLSEKAIAKPYIADNLANHLLSNFFIQFSDDLEKLTIKKQQRILEDYQDKLADLRSKK